MITDWGLFWTAFGAIGGTVGALATTAAVVVALWQTKYANMKKLKIQFSDDIILVPSNGDFSRKHKYIEITVTNIGNRNIRLTNCCIMLPHSKSAFILQNHSNLAQQLSASWPITIQPEERTQQLWDIQLFYMYVKKHLTDYKYKSDKIIWCVSDSTGKEYKIRTSKSISQYLKEANELDERPRKILCKT